MPRYTTVQCAFCKANIEKDMREYNRSTKLGRLFFCNLSCSARASNALKQAVVVTVFCPCGREVSTTTKARAPSHCSRACASRFSMTDERREAQRAGGHLKVGNLLSTAEALKQREHWKYAALEPLLVLRI